VELYSNFETAKTAKSRNQRSIYYKNLAFVHVSEQLVAFGSLAFVNWHTSVSGLSGLNCIVTSAQTGAHRNVSQWIPALAGMTVSAQTSFDGPPGAVLQLIGSSTR